MVLKRKISKMSHFLSRRMSITSPLLEGEENTDDCNFSDLYFVLPTIVLDRFVLFAGIQWKEYCILTHMQDHH